MNDKRKTQQQARRAWYLQHNICVVCGRRDALPNRQKCTVCTEKATLNNIKYRSLDRERTYYEKRKAKRQERIANGLCPRCGKIAVKGQLCIDCYAKKQKQHEQEKREREARGDPRRERIKNGKCWFCDNVALPGMKVCKSHYRDLENRTGFWGQKGEEHPWVKAETLRYREIRAKR